MKANFGFPKRLINIYSGIKQRCYNPNVSGYKYCGKKGIIMCKEWLNDSKSFYKWAMNNGYRDDLMISRRDVSKNFYPNNCQWASREVIANNKSNSIHVEINGKIKTATQWSREIGIQADTIKKRFKKGKDILKDSFIKIEINGKIKTIKELSQESGIPYDTIIQRYRAGWDHDKLTSELLTNETKYIEIHGEIHTVTEWCEISGLDRNIILNRISWGWSNEELLLPKRYEHKKKYIEIDGKIHTIKEWCEILNICRMSFHRKLKNGKFENVVEYY